MPMQKTSKKGSSAPAPVSIQVHRNIAEIGERWRAFQKDAIGGPHDTREWNEAWARTAGKACDPFIVVGRDEHGDVLFMLPLTIRRRMGCTVLEWLGADQGNYTSGLFHPTAWEKYDLPRGGELMQRVLAVLPRVDAVHLTNQPSTIGACDNPLAGLPGVAAASAGHTFALNSNWQSHFNKKFSSRQRGRLRSCERQIGKQGKVRFEDPKNATRRVELIDHMIDEKRQWFAGKGIPDFLAQADMREFFRSLAQVSDGETGPVARIFTLRVDDEIVATNLGLIHHNRFYGLMASTTAGPLRRHGPGRLLFLRLIKKLAKEGIELVDCGAGEDEYKLRWCTDERVRMHAIVAIGARGRIYASALEAVLKAKLKVKQTPALWTSAKRMRQWTAVLRKTKASLTTRHAGSFAAGFQACNNVLKRVPNLLRPLGSH